MQSLKSLLSDGDSIDVVTTIPNRYRTFVIEADEFEIQDKLQIKRIKIPLHQSGFFDQSKSFLVYMMKTLKYVQGKKYDIVFATSSRLLSAFLGAVISRRKNIPLYLDIRDVFTDTMLSVLNKSKLKSIVPLFMMMERFAVRSACNINFVSEGFIFYFKEKYGQDLIHSFYPNGIDDDFLNFNCNRLIKKNKAAKIRFTYTGNIGEGQGLEKIIPQIVEKYPNIEFYIIGDGGRKQALQKCTAYMQNVKLINPVKRMDLVKYYDETDFLFLQLNDYNAFKKVLPSKIFEYAATYKPIIAGVDGYARDFIKCHLPDSLIYKPCDIDDFCEKFNGFDTSINLDKRHAFINKFSRKNIMDAMARDFLSILKG